MTQPKERRFTITWTRDPRYHTFRSPNGDYAIRQDGDWILVYNGTIVHRATAQGHAGITECKIEADKHRGVSSGFHASQ